MTMTEKPRRRQPLRLNKETLRRLSSTELAHAVGGVDSGSDDEDPVTFANCPTDRCRKPSDVT
jgi:hypothetical protein